MAADGALRRDPRGERPGVDVDETAARSVRSVLGVSVVMLAWTSTGNVGDSYYEARLADGGTAGIDVMRDRSAVVISCEGGAKSTRFVCGCGEVLASWSASGVARKADAELSPLHGVRSAGAIVACSTCLAPDTVRGLAAAG